MDGEKYKAKVFCKNCNKVVEISVYKGYTVYRAINNDRPERCPVCDTDKLQELKRAE